MTKTKLRLANILLFFCAEVLFAQSSLKIEDALKIAAANNGLLRAAEQDIKIAEYEAKRCLGKLFPALTFKGGYRKQSEDSYASGTLAVQTDSEVKRDKNMYNLSCELESVLYSGGANFSRYKAARAEVMYREALYKLKSEQVQVGVKNAFYRIITEQEKIRFLEESVESFRKHHKIIKSKYEARVILKTELFSSEAELLSIKQKLSQARSDLSAAKSELSKLMGKSVDEIKGELKFNDEDLEIEQIKKNAENCHPRIKMAECELFAAKNGLKISRAGFFRPRLKLLGSYALNENMWIPDEDEWSVGIGVEVPLFSGGGSLSDIKKNKAREKKAEILMDYMKSEIKADIDTAYSQFRRTGESVKLTEVRVKQAEENLNISRSAFKAGTMSNAQFLEARKNMTDAEINYLEILYNYHQAKSKMEFYSSCKEAGQ